MSDMPSPGTPLSRREHEVVQLLSTHADYIEISKDLGISASTVAMHAARAMARTGAANLFQLGMWAQCNGYRPGTAPTFRDDQCNCGPNCDGRNCAAQVNA